MTLEFSAAYSEKVCTCMHSYYIHSVFRITLDTFDTIHSYVQSKVTGTQRHVVDLLYECVLITDGLALLPRWFLNYKL